MPKQYLITLCLFLSLPVVALIAMSVYCFVTAKVTTGGIMLAAAAFVGIAIAAVVFTMRNKYKK